MSPLSAQSTCMLATPHLDLVGATPALLKAEMHDRHCLSRLLGADVPVAWPPEHNDLTTMRFMLDLLEGDPANLAWAYFYVVLRASTGGRRLIGGCGFKGKPDDSGSVEIGYSFLSDYQSRGFGTEAVSGLLEHAFADSRVECVVAETFADLTPSIRVLQKNGFRPEGFAAEPGALRFALHRADYLA